MPGFTPTEARQFDAYITNEPDVMEFICPKNCENPDHHINLEYCPEEIATTIVGWVENDVELKDYWNSIHDLLMNGDDTACEVVRISESEHESRNLYAAWKGVQG